YDAEYGRPLHPKHQHRFSDKHQHHANASKGHQRRQQVAHPPRVGYRKEEGIEGKQYHEGVVSKQIHDNHYVAEPHHHHAGVVSKQLHTCESAPLKHHQAGLGSSVQPQRVDPHNLGSELKR
ncbi:hypothetical protein A2U01_0058040, partial [Trifolium medium]|nr:hypothetical protein [Trifolium medium]